MKIYNLGSLNIDYVYKVERFVSAGETVASHSLDTFPGGKGLNQSVALARAGVAVIHGGIIGNGGEFLVDTLQESGVDASRIEKRNISNGHAIIQIDRGGQNCIMLYAGTNHLIDREYALHFLADAEEGDIILLQNEISGLDEIFRIAAEKKMSIAFNPSPLTDSIKALPLDTVRWWFCNEIEGAELFGSGDIRGILEGFTVRYPHSSLILTLGRDGSVYKDSAQEIHQSIYEVETVDTTAAGDTFMGYFIAMIASGKCEIEAMKYASAASSVTVSRMGASSSIPYLDEVNT